MPRVLSDARSRIRFERNAGESVRHVCRRNRGVVGPAPQLTDLVRRADDPPEPQSWQPVRLRERVRDQHPIVAAPEGGGRLCVHIDVRFRAGVHFVGHDPRAVALGQLRDRVHRLTGQGDTGRVVRIGDEHEADSFRQRPLERFEIGLPAVLLQELYRGQAASERLQQPGHLAVRGQDDRRFALALEEVPETREIRFGSSYGDEHGRRRRARI